MCKGVSCVDLGESFQLNIYFPMSCKNRPRYNRERALQNLGGRQAGLAACPVPTPPGSTKQRRLLRLVRVGQPLLEDAHDFVHAVHDELPALIDLRQNGSIIFSRTVHFRRLVRGCIKTRLEEKKPLDPRRMRLLASFSLRNIAYANCLNELES